MESIFPFLEHDTLAQALAMLGFAKAICDAGEGDQCWADAISGWGFRFNFLRLNNQNNMPEFYVASSFTTRMAVVAIRGFCAFNFMDFSAEPVYVQLLDGTSGGCTQGYVNLEVLLKALWLKAQLGSTLMELENRGYDVYMTGVSFGGAIATMLALLLKFDLPTLQCITFGAPPVRASLNTRLPCLPRNLLRTVVYW